MASKPPKLSFEAFRDKREAVEIWLDQFNDWCVLQKWRDTTKPTTDNAHWKQENYACELSAFRLGLPADVLRVIKSTLEPQMGTDATAGDAKEKYRGYPWVWQKFLLSHYSGQDTVLAERMTFLETCKQRTHESVADFESRCKYHGLRCEYKKMNDPEEELIRDRFVTGISDDKLRAELLRHKHPDGSVVTLSEVVAKAKAWEAAMQTNTKLMQSLTIEEQVNFSSSRSSTPKRASKSGPPTCGYCGERAVHTRRSCPAGKPGVVCSNCFGRNHFASVCRSPKKSLQKSLPFSQDTRR